MGEWEKSKRGKKKNKRKGKYIGKEGRRRGRKENEVVNWERDRRKREEKIGEVLRGRRAGGRPKRC